MHATAHSPSPSQRASKGIALAGVSVIAAASIGLMPQAAQLPDPIKISTAATQLVAQVNPLETLIEALNTAGAGVQTVFGKWQSRPAPLLQQIIANQLAYGTIVTKSLTTEVSALRRYAGQLTDPAFVRQLADDLAHGEVQAVYNSIAKILIPAGYVLVPALTNIANIPAYVLTNMAATVKALAGSGLSAIGTAAFTVMLGTSGAVATGLQGAIDAANEGDPLGALENIANIPGLMANNVLNGANGLLSPTGLLGQLLVRIPQIIASTIVAPGAQNIFKGGTLDAAVATLTASLRKLAGAFGVPAPAAATAAAINGLAPKALTSAALAAGSSSNPATMPSLKAVVHAVTLSAATGLVAKPVSGPSDTTGKAEAKPVSSDQTVKVETRPATKPSDIDKAETKPSDPTGNVENKPATKPSDPTDRAETKPVSKPTTKPTAPKAEPRPSKPKADSTSSGSTGKSVARAKGSSPTGPSSSHATARASRGAK